MCGGGASSVFFCNVLSAAPRSLDHLVCGAGVWGDEFLAEKDGGIVDEGGCLEGG